MSYWDNYNIDELNIIKEKLTIITKKLETELDIFTNLIDDINKSLEGRKY